MTDKERIEKLEKQVEDLKLARDTVFTESLKKRVLQNIIFAGIISTSLTDINETTVIPAGGGSVTHAEAFDKKVRVEIDGVPYYLGLYTA